MGKALGFLALILLAPCVFSALVTPIPDDWIALAVIAPFAGWLLASFAKGR